MGARKFSGPLVPINISARVEEVVHAMVKDRVPVNHNGEHAIEVRWNSSLTYAAARVGTGLTRKGEVLYAPRMELSSKVWPLLTQAEADTILIHESAHVAAALLGLISEGHGHNWRKLMRDYNGIAPRRCLSEDITRRILQHFPRKRRARRVKSQWVSLTLNDIFSIPRK